VMTGMMLGSLRLNGWRLLLDGTCLFRLNHSDSLVG
jgi:hypothetical protein